MRTRILQIVSLVILLVSVPTISGYSDTAGFSPSSTTYFPDDDWESTTPEEQEMSSSVLDEMIQHIEDVSAPMRGLIVTRNGYIVKEDYWAYNTNRTPFHIFSCTKSFTGTLVGIAIKEGFIDNVSQRVIDFFPGMTIENLDARKENMTLEHVLTMTTGLDWNEWNNSYFDPTNMYNQMFGSSNPIQFFLNLPMAYDPGEQWMYTTGASHLLSAIIQETTTMTTREFAEEYLFDPLNMTIGGWNIDSQGINNGGTQLYVTARAMAKLGLLYLNNGSWDGQEILPEDWTNQTSSPHANIAPGMDYGYQWWIDTPDGSYHAAGSEGQYIYVFPDFNVVISMTAHADEPGEDIHEDILQYILSSIDEYEPSTPGGGGDILPLVALVSVAIGVFAVVVIYVRRS
ncbi:MAG: serine hydrolase domain-containing protein [Candidatus Thorarchaeota archaeon]|jgi:CubicO group peptidase (beta-lactamase class C family)